MDNGIKSFLSEVEQLSCNALTVSKKLLKDGKEEVTVNLERRKVMPDRMESPPRSHRFYDVAGFVEYLERNKTDHTLIMANVTTHIIGAVLDDTQKDGFESITLEPAPFPAFVMLSKLLNREMLVHEFASLAMRNRRILGESELAGTEFAMLMQQITISSKVTACIGSGRKSINGLMCSTEVKSGEPNAVSVDMPDTIKATVPLYVNRPEVSFDIDLTVTANQREALIHADAPELEVYQYEEMQKMLAEITSDVGDELQTAVGKLYYGEWNYNK